MKINKSNVTSGTEVKQVNVVVKKGEYQSAPSIQINKDFLTKVKIDSEHTIYKVICRDCVSYMPPASSGGIVTSAIIQGRMDGKEQEFKTKELAQLAIDEHKTKKPLHNPEILLPIIEYLTRNDKHMVRYRRGEYDNPTIHVHTVDGFHISSDKCAYECNKCGAIYQSKGEFGHTMFKTSDPRCANEVHPENEIGMDGNRQRNLTKICVCPDLEQQEQIEENIRHIEWCKAHPDKATKCHICGAIPDSDHPEEIGYTILTTNWHRFLWGNDGYDERLVCEDCYYTNPKYKNCYGIKARRQYLAKKKRMQKRRNEI